MVTKAAAAVEERTVAEIKRLSFAGLSATDLLSRSARTLHRTIPFEAYSAATIDPASNLITQAFGERIGDSAPPKPANPAYFERFYFQEGFDVTLGLVRQRRWATTITDLTDGRPELSLCYRDSLRPAGLADKLSALFFDRQLWGDLELYRGDGVATFSAAEIGVAQRVAPLIGSGLKTAALRVRAADEATPDDVPGVVVLDRSRKVVSVTPAAHRLLAELSPLDTRWRHEEDLPIAVQVVVGALDQALAPRTNGDTNAMPSVKVRGSKGRWLTLHASLSEPTADRPEEHVVVIGATRPDEIAWLTLGAYALSPREEDVVKLVVSGFSTKQIGDRLFIDEHTVQRHLSNVFEKVGVRSRRALVKELFFEHLLPAMN